MFCWKLRNYFFLLGDSDRSASCRTRARRGRPPNWTLGYIKRSNFSSLLFIWNVFTIINPFSWLINAVSNEKGCSISMTLWHQADWLINLTRFQGATWLHESRNFKLLFTQGGGEFWTMTHDTFTSNKSENVIELGDITMIDGHCLWNRQVDSWGLGNSRQRASYPFFQ